MPWNNFLDPGISKMPYLACKGIVVLTSAAFSLGQFRITRLSLKTRVDWLLMSGQAYLAFQPISLWFGMRYIAELHSGQGTQCKAMGKQNKL